jgi:DNA-binding transcriptional LysR family regulator
MDTRSLMDMMLFVQVVDMKSFSAVADKLDMSKSVVSKRITRLETHLGVRLLNRSTRKLSLTDAGHSLYEHCSHLYADAMNAEHAVSKTQSQARGTLRISAPTGIGNKYISPIVSEFVQEYSDLKIDLVLGQATQDLIGDQFDIAIRFWEQPSSSLIAKKLVTKGMTICASKAYLKKRGIPKTPEELLDHNCLIHSSQPYKGEWSFNYKGETKRVSVDGNFRSNSSLALRTAAKNNLGIAMLPEFLAYSSIKKKKLVSILDDYSPKDMSIYAMYLSRDHLPPKIRLFIDFLVKKFNQKDFWI